MMYNKEIEKTECNNSNCIILAEQNGFCSNCKGPVTCRPKRYVTKQIPLSEADIIARRAAATGSVPNVPACADANYNGNPVDVVYHTHAVGDARWTAGYHWSGPVRLCRGNLRACLAAARVEYNKGHRGAMIAVTLCEEAPELMEEQIALCISNGLYPVPDDIESWRYDTQLGKRVDLKYEVRKVITGGNESSGAMTAYEVYIDTPEVLCIEVRVATLEFAERYMGLRNEGVDHQAAYQYCQAEFERLY